MPSKSKLGTGLFIFSEANFFLVLIIAYVYYHLYSQNGPNAGNSLHPGVTAVFSVLLYASSGTMLLAHRSFRRGNRSKLITWLSITILFGAIFLVGQGIEYTSLFHQQITVATNLFGSTFFTLTGFHGLHVLIGLCLLALMLGLTANGRLRLPQAAEVEAAGLQAGFESIAMYWHFVDAVWVFIFPIVYLWPLIGR